MCSTHLRHVLLLGGGLLAAACSDDTSGATAGAETNASSETDASSETNASSESGTESETTSEPDLPMPDMAPEIDPCEPTGGGPHWMLEGESIEIQISCATGLPLGGADFELSPLPLGSTYDPVTARLSWTPTLGQGLVYDIQITALPTNEVGALRIGVADDFNHPNNVPVLDPYHYTYEYGLPVLHLQTDIGINHDLFTPADVIYAGMLYTAEAKYRGASSFNYPKKSYTLKFAKEHKFNEPDFADGFLEKREIVLTTTFDDNTYIRQRLAYELWNRLDPGHIQVQAYNAVVFLDGRYWGLYMIGDHVDGYLMEDHGLWQDGDLYKARTHDANFTLLRNDGTPKATLHDGYTKSEGFPIDGAPGAYDPLDELVNFVATSSDQQFLAELDTRIDRRDYEDWWIFVTAISARDSGGKNSYHYHDPNGGLWRYIPWDFNHSFGQDWRTLRVGTGEWPEEYRGRNNLFGRMLDEPTIGPALRDRYMLTLEQQFELGTILDTIDAWALENHPSALRDQGMWGDDYVAYSGWNWRTDFLDHDGELAYMRTWLIERWAYLATLY